MECYTPSIGGLFIIIFICLRRENVFFLRVITCSQRMHSIKLDSSISFHTNYWKLITEKRWKFPEIKASHFVMLLLWITKRSNKIFIHVHCACYMLITVTSLFRFQMNQHMERIIMNSWGLKYIISYALRSTYTGSI